MKTSKVMYEYAASAFIFGLTAGLKPGPLGIVIIQQTLQNGLRQGLRASLAPIITDGPIIAFALLLLTQLRDMSLFIGVLSLFGGLYLFWLAAKILKIKKMEISKSLNRIGSLSMAIKVNFLNPNPYLFWFTVGGSYIILGTTAQSFIFVVVSIGTLVLSKMLVAWVASRFREILDSRAYLWIMRALGILLAAFGILLLGKSYNALLM